MLYVIKRTYSATYPARGLRALPAWLVHDDERAQVWTLERERAVSFETTEAHRLIAEARRNRPEHTYELTALEG